MTAPDLLERYKVEINTHDFNRVEPLIADDCAFWFSSGTFAGKVQARAAFERTWGLIKDEVYTISDVAWIAESEAAAVCVYTFHWRGLIDGASHQGTGRGTSVFRRDADGWKIVREHLSAFQKA